MSENLRQASEKEANDGYITVPNPHIQPEYQKTTVKKGDLETTYTIKTADILDLGQDIVIQPEHVIPPLEAPTQTTPDHILLKDPEIFSLADKDTFQDAMPQENLTQAVDAAARIQSLRGITPTATENTSSTDASLQRSSSETTMNIFNRANSGMDM